MREKSESSARWSSEPLESEMGLRLELFVEDMDAAIDFYTRVVGLEPPKASLHSTIAE